MNATTGQPAHPVDTPAVLRVEQPAGRWRLFARAIEDGLAAVRLRDGLDVALIMSRALDRLRGAATTHAHTSCETVSLSRADWDRVAAIVAQSALALRDCVAASACSSADRSRWPLSAEWLDAFATELAAARSHPDLTVWRVCISRRIPAPPPAPR